MVVLGGGDVWRQGQNLRRDSAGFSELSGLKVNCIKPDWRWRLSGPALWDEQLLHDFQIALTRINTT